MEDYLSPPAPPAQEPAAGAQREADPAMGDWPAIERLLVSLQLPKGQAAALVRDLYERELPTQLAALTAAVQADDRPQAARLAHKLRGGSRQLGALALASACAALESAAKDPGTPALSAELAHVHTIYDQTWTWLQARLCSIIEAE